MLKIKNNKIVDEKGKEIKLRGMSLGGWLMMEGYMLGGKNIPERIFKEQLDKTYGNGFANEFSKRFRQSFITAEDFSKIKELGFNCVRLPFNYRLLKEEGGLGLLKYYVGELAKRELYVILDMHAVPGSQNTDWHSDSTGEAKFWESEENRKEYLKLWEELSKTFKDEKWVAGYDIMNEPVTDKIKLLQQVYQDAINIIRKNGDEHIIFLEGNNWASEIDFQKDIAGENLAISVHFYQPIFFTFRWLHDSKYPGIINGEKWDKTVIKKFLQKYSDLSKELKRPVYVGEFGIASRCFHCGKEFNWVEDVLDVMKSLNFHWTYWTYKSVIGMNCPDGLFQLSDASGIIGDPSKDMGMENFYNILKDRKDELFKLLDTCNFKMNKFLYNMLKKYL